MVFDDSMDGRSGSAGECFVMWSGRELGAGASVCIAEQWGKARIKRGCGMGGSCGRVGGDGRSGWWEVGVWVDLCILYLCVIESYQVV
jgi:hypothetical protein